MPAIFWHGMAWDYALMIRARTSGGQLVGTFQAGSWWQGNGGNQGVMAGLMPGAVGSAYTYIAPTVLGPPTFEKEQIPREGLDRSRNPLTIGFRPKLHVEWIQKAQEVWGAVGSGLTNLRNIISYLTTSGDYLELALDGWLLSPHYRIVNLVSDVYEYQSIDGRDIGVVLALDFEGKALISSVPAVDATSWGTAL